MQFYSNNLQYQNKQEQDSHTTIAGGVSFSYQINTLSVQT